MILLCTDYFINWDAISALSNIAIAFLALCSLVYSIYLLYRERKQRIEDVRARLTFCVVEWQDLYMLKITNVGKETAYGIKLNVSGSPITENPINFVREVFTKLRTGTINIEAGKSVYYLISPSESAEGKQGLEGGKEYDMMEIKKWLLTQVNEKISIKGVYNNRYMINEVFTIRDFNQIGAFVINDPLQSIAEAITSHDYNDKSIPKNIQIVANEIKKKSQG